MLITIAITDRVYQRNTITNAQLLSEKAETIFYLQLKVLQKVLSLSHRLFSMNKGRCGKKKISECIKSTKFGTFERFQILQTD